MAIFRREHLAHEKNELARFYAELVAALEGVPPSAGMAPRFHQDAADFSRDFADIDLHRLNAAIGHFKVAVDALKHIKEKAQKPVHRG